MNKGDLTSINNEYRRRTVGKRKYIHREIMEEFLGRELKRDEQIHHINGDKLDNRIDNLLLLNNKEHQRLHINSSMSSFSCIVCSKEFQGCIWRKQEPLKYCSVKCKSRWHYTNKVRSKCPRL